MLIGWWLAKLRYWLTNIIVSLCQDVLANVYQPKNPCCLTGFWDSPGWVSMWYISDIKWGDGSTSYPGPSSGGVNFNHDRTLFSRALDIMVFIGKSSPFMAELFRLEDAENPSKWCGKVSSNLPCQLICVHSSHCSVSQSFQKFFDWLSGKDCYIAIKNGPVKVIYHFAIENGPVERSWVFPWIAWWFSRVFGKLLPEGLFHVWCILFWAKRIKSDFFVWLPCILSVLLVQSKINSDAIIVLHIFVWYPEVTMTLVISSRPSHVDILVEDITEIPICLSMTDPPVYHIKSTCPYNYTQVYQTSSNFLRYSWHEISIFI